MSYILDALKKSEEKRMQGTVPDVLTAQEVVYHEPKRRRLWPYLIISVLLLNALAAVWLVPWKSKKSNAVVESSALTKLALRGHDSLSGGIVKPGSPAAAVAESGANTLKPASEMKPLHSGAVTQPHQFSPVKDGGQKKVAEVPKPATDAKESHDASVPSSQAPAMAEPAEPKHPVDALPIPNKVYSLSELPLSLQQKLPSFGISVFLYSDDPASRMVKINNKMLREGDYLSEGLKLEEINQNSLILSYQSFRFRVGLK